MDFLLVYTWCSMLYWRLVSCLKRSKRCWFCSFHNLFANIIILLYFWSWCQAVTELYDQRFFWKIRSFKTNLIVPTMKIYQGRMMLQLATKSILIPWLSADWFSIVSNFLAVNFCTRMTKRMFAALFSVFWLDSIATCDVGDGTTCCAVGLLSERTVH